MTIKKETKTREELLHDARIQLIVYSLFNANSGQEVYEALKLIPVDNLESIKNMIIDILNKKRMH